MAVLWFGMDENQRNVGKKWKSAKGKMELETFLGLYK
jgi:hypothetical protein